MLYSRLMRSLGKQFIASENNFNSVTVIKNEYCQFVRIRIEGKQGEKKNS